MKEWYAAAALAGLKLPDLPATDRGVKLLADRRAWHDARDVNGNPLARRRQGRGGGWEYHYSLLPARAQAALIARQPKSLGAAAAEDCRPDNDQRGQARNADLWDWYERQPEKKKAVAAARLRAVESVHDLYRGGLQKNLAVNEVARREGIGPSTLYTWLQLTAGHDRADWLPHLCPRHQGRTATAECSPEAWEFLKRLYLSDEKRQFQFCYDLLAEAAAEHGWTIPAARTLERRIATDIPRAIRVYWREGPEAAKRLYPHQERDRTGFHALEAVNADGHKWDVFVRWPDGEIARPIMLAVQDLYSNKIVGWRIDRTENAELVRLAFKDVFGAYGIPAMCFLDNGRGFAAKCVTGGAPNRYRFKVKPEEPLGVMTALGIDVRWTRPYSGQSKPIERAFGELCQRIAKHPVFEGAYTGNRPDAKPESYGSRAVDLETFLAVVGKGIVKYNARPGRNTRVCARVKSFDQAFAESYARSPIRKARPEHLRMCLMAAAALRADQKSGSIRLMGNRYWSEALVELAGTPLTVRFDPEDLHDGVHVYRQDGSYVGVAECLEAAGFADASAAREHARKFKAYRRGLREIAALERAMTLDQLVALMPDVEEGDPGSSPGQAVEARVVRPVVPRGNLALRLDREAREEKEGFDDAFAASVASLAAYRREQI